MAFLARCAEIFPGGGRYVRLHIQVARAGVSAGKVVAGRRQHDHFDVFVMSGYVEGRVEFSQKLEGLRVFLLGAIEDDPGDIVLGLLVFDGGKFCSHGWPL